jgi:hypothetical protein
LYGHSQSLRQVLFVFTCALNIASVTLSLSRYQEEFAAFMPPLVKVVWELANASPGGGFADECVHATCGMHVYF